MVLLKDSKFIKSFPEMPQSSILRQLYKDLDSYKKLSSFLLLSTKTSQNILKVWLHSMFNGIEIIK
jgi:hypothetical protein